MTDQQHSITPPPELVRQWDEECDSGHNPEIDNTFDALKCFASKAARWGADQELEACLQWFSEFYCMETWMQKDLEKLRTARRPKPTSLKEQALDILQYPKDFWSEDEVDTIRRALEALND